MEIVLLVLCACAACAHTETQVEYVHVDTSLGKIRGYRDQALGQHVDVFYGIPFAKPPTGERRFQRSETVSSWQGTLDATRRPASCYQSIDFAFDKFPGVDMWNPNTNMSEDCLYLNLWMPSSRNYGVKQRAVMVWVYGGGFYGGTSTLDLYDGRIFAVQNDIIVVSMQYRVGALGFLYLGHASAPGNVGLVDQQLALQWIYNHIESFGGDKHQVTLFGESAGAVSVSLHLVSPLSKRLFKYAIMQSGSALCRWAIEGRARAKSRSLAIAEKVGCKIEGEYKPVNEVIACMLEADPVTMTREMWTLQDDYNLITPMLVTIDGYFLREHPFTSVKKGDVKKTNILLGSNKDEGSYFLVYGIQGLFNIKKNQTLPKEEYESVIEAMARSKMDILEDAIHFEYGVPREYGTEMKYRDILDDVVGDSEFICPVVEFANHYAQQKNEVYMYQFTHRTSGNPWPKWMGVMHGYEIDQVFGVPLNTTYNYTSEEQELSKRVMTYWTNFAKKGSPNGGAAEWLPFTVEDKHYMVIDTGPPVIKQGLRHRQCQFWGSYMSKLKLALTPSDPQAYPADCNGANPMNSYFSYSLILILLSKLLQHI